MSDIDADVLTGQLVNAALERAVARRELRELGINASPADTEAWLGFTSRQRREACMAWAVMQNEALARRKQA